MNVSGELLSCKNLLKKLKKKPELVAGLKANSGR